MNRITFKLIRFLFCLCHIFGVLFAEASLAANIVFLAAKGYRDGLTIALCILAGLAVHCFLVVFLTKHKILDGKELRILLYFDGLLTCGVSLLLAMECALGNVRLPLGQFLLPLGVNACILIICFMMSKYRASQK